MASHPYPPSDENAYRPFDAQCTDEELRSLVGDLNNPRQIEFAFRSLTACGSEAAPYLARVFQSSEPDQQRQALAALTAMGADAKAAIPALEAGLTDSNLRAQIPQALATIGGADVLSILLGTLRHRDPAVQLAAVIALGSLKAEASPAVPALRSVLRNPQLSSEAAQAIGQIGPRAQTAVPDLIDRLSGDANSRASAAEALGSIGPAARAAIPALVELLGERTAVRALAGIGAASVPELIEAAKSPDATVQRNAVEALGLIGPEAAAAVPLLGRLMSSSDLSLRAQVFRALTNIGRPAVPTLITALDAPSLRAMAAISLGNIGPEAEAAIPALLEIFEQPTFVESEPRRPVQPGSRPERPSRPQIRPELRLPSGPQIHAELERSQTLVNPGPSPGRSIRLSAALALGNIGANTEVVVPELIGLLNQDDLVVRSEAARALGNLGPVAAPAIPDLVKLMAAPGSFPKAIDTRNIAASALINLGSLAVPELITALADPEPMIHSRAAFALGQIGEPAIAPLSAPLNHRSETVRRRAAFALGQIGPPAVPALLETLTANGLAQRKAAAYGLGMAEVSSPEVIAALQSLVDDNSVDLDLRRIAASSLERLGVEQSSFFSAFNGPGPQTSACLPQSNDSAFPPRLDNYEFDIFTGDCLLTYEEKATTTPAGLGDILTRLCELFGC
ncbi:MAG: HEAT repeat domain-containing protein [Cyanobacteria bacterium J06635_1]